MRVLSYLVLLLMFSVASAQTPTILQGDYISNVFGNSNFILNPNAQTSNCTTSGTMTCANVTVTNASITRVTTTPLVARTEFNVAITSANGTATWATRAFDAGMKGQNCEARFTYRGFAATSKVHIKQGANTVASLNLTPATDPRIASINFPCGDLSAATTFVVTDTAILAGTNEIGAIYTGLATNMANVAQAEAVVIAGRNTNQTIVTTGNIVWNNEQLDVFNELDTSTGIFTAKKAGLYEITSSIFSDSQTWSTNQRLDMYIQKIGASTSESVSGSEQQQITSGRYISIQRTLLVQLAVGDQIRVKAESVNPPMTFTIFGSVEWTRLQIKRFPTSSELVVTPERQNTFAGIKGVANGPTNSVTTNAWTKLTSTTTLTRTNFGKTKLETNNDYSITIDNMPVGSYYITVTGLFYVQAAGSGVTTECWFGLADTATGGAQIGALTAISTSDATSANQAVANSTLGGIYTVSSVASKTFFVQSYRSSGNGTCQGYSRLDSPLTISVIPLDQPSNSALYVQGPVLGAQTGAAIPSGYLGKSEFGGGFGSSGAVATGTSTVYTISNVTPGVYMVRYYSSAQRAGATTATYYGYSCAVTSNGSASYNWFDYLNTPQNFIGSDGASFTGFGSGGHLPSSTSSNIAIVNVTTTTTYYVRCGYDSNNSGVLVHAGAEFIRLN